MMRYDKTLAPDEKSPAYLAPTEDTEYIVRRPVV